jgi:hypothetical protein
MNEVEEKVKITLRSKYLKIIKMPYNLWMIKKMNIVIVILENQ